MSLMDIFVIVIQDYSIWNCVQIHENVTIGNYLILYLCTFYTNMVFLNQITVKIPGNIYLKDVIVN